MSVRAEQWRWLVGVGLASVLMVLGLAVLAPAASAAPTDSASRTGLCWYRQWFNGKHYCPADGPGVKSTRYGVGRRVYLDGAIPIGFTDDSISFVVPECGSCENSVDITIPWKGPHRPAVDTSGPYTLRSVRIYGTTTEGNVTPTGYVTTGNCYWEPLCGD